jgi:hypothetical protein
MPDTARDAYTSWCRDGVGYFGTWAPGTNLNPGTVGILDKNARFQSHPVSLGSFGVQLRMAPLEPFPAMLNFPSRAWKIEVESTGRVRGRHANATAEAKVTAAGKHALALHFRDCQEERLDEICEQDCLRAIAQGLIDKRWHPSWVLVCARVIAQDGFAAAGATQGRSVHLAADAGVTLPEYLEPAELKSIAGSVSLDAQKTVTENWLFQFGQNSTPVFHRIAIIRPNIWARLTRRHDLKCPSGLTFKFRKQVPSYLTLAAEEPDLRYDDSPGAEITPEEIQDTDAVFKDITLAPGRDDAL